MGRQSHFRDTVLSGFPEEHESRVHAFAFVRSRARTRARVAPTFRIALAALALASACSAPRDAADTSAAARATGGDAGDTSAATHDSASARDALRVSHALREDLTGDGRGELLTLDARGPRMDSLDIRLEIRSAGDSVLYRSTWRSRSYFEYLERSSMADSAADALVRRQLARVLGDTAFGTVGAGGFIAFGSTRSPADTSLVDMMRDAVRHDIATHQWRRSNRVSLDAELPRAAHDPIGVLAKAVPADSIDAVIDDLRGHRAFHYSVGGETSYAIAWSDRQQRFVTIFACC